MEIKVKYDGKWIDDQVKGFRVLAVEGKDAVGQELDVTDDKYSDGTTLNATRLPPREIKVTYTIDATTLNDRKKARNKLAFLLLKKKDKQLIFSDEDDKYFLATVSHFTQTEITFYCADPLKYSVLEKQFTLSGNKFNIQNDGTVPVSVRYELAFSSGAESGYLGIASDQGAMEYGVIEEKDKVWDKRNEFLVSFNDMANASYVTGGENVHHMRAINQAQDENVGYTVNRWLELLPDGSDSNLSWGRAMKTVTIPKPTEPVNETPGARDFSCKTYHWFQTSNINQSGEQVIQFMDGNNNEICAFGITKRTTNNNNAMCYFRLNGRMVKSFNFPAWHISLGNNNNPFGAGVRGHNMVQKVGGRFTFFWNGSYFHFTDNSLKDTKCMKAQFSISRWPGHNYITRNYLGDFSFQRLNIEGEFSRVNTFRPGSSFVIDGYTHKFYVNGMHRPDLEVLGTDYFKVIPGASTVQVSPSNWFSGTITGKAYIREAWL